MSPMPADAVVDVAPTTVPAPDAIAHERCDRCGARAYVVTMHDGGFTLAWCGHHYRAHQDSLAGAAGVLVVHDIRDQLVPAQKAQA